MHVKTTMVNRLVLSLILFFMTLSSFASSGSIDEARIQSMLGLSSSYKQDGPNCFASVFFAKGLINDASYVGSDFTESLLASPFCRLLTSAKELESGDLVFLGNKSDKLGQWTHAILFLGADKVFAKMGFMKDDPTQIVSLLENVKWYVSQDSSLRPSYFRCDTEAFHSSIEQSDLAMTWKTLLILRKKIFAETLREAKENHEMVLEDLKALEETVLRSQAPAHVRKSVSALISNTREQLHMIDVFIVY
ncbi:hypothetical protein [Bdellovibrio bacteriovorus]|uniref:hypothetical protein n=1 Tax=Bdellovibrio TaxID=958 RepID=UPI0035A86AAA